jgi:hypothetical protein
MRHLSAGPAPELQSTGDNCQHQEKSVPPGLLVVGGARTRLWVNLAVEPAQRGGGGCGRPAPVRHSGLGSQPLVRDVRTGRLK